MTFGVPKDDLAASVSPGTEITSGSISDWKQRGDAAIVGEALAARRGVSVGDRFSAAGVTVYIAGILTSSEMQDRNSAWVHLPFLQETMRRGGTGGFVTQFNVVVDDPDEDGRGRIGHR